MPSKANKSKAGARKAKLHDQEWRDFQPVLDAESSAERFKAALKRAQTRVKAKSKAGASRAAEAQS